jgi:hypothetical protein
MVIIPPFIFVPHNMQELSFYCSLQKLASRDDVMQKHDMGIVANRVSAE